MRIELLTFDKLGEIEHQWNLMIARHIHCNGAKAGSELDYAAEICLRKGWWLIKFR